MKTTIIVLFFLASFAVRSLRWLGIVQQKEYRLDRVLLFVFSKEGMKEFLRFLPKKSDFSKTGLKRPKITSRSVLMAGIFSILSYIFFRYGMQFLEAYLLQMYPYPRWYLFFCFLFLLFIYLIVIPIFAVVSAIPTVILAHVQTYKRLYQARKKLLISKPKVIGITGSYGKTSTKLLLAHVLGKKFSVFVTPKSYNTKYSVAHSIVKGYSDEEIAIIEYAAYKKGEIKELAKWVRPDMAIITGLTKQHVGLFGSLQEIIHAKAELVASLPEKATVICNIYDKQTQEIVTLGAKDKNLESIFVDSDAKSAHLDTAKINSEGKLLVNWDGQGIQTHLIGVQYRELVHLVIVTALQFGMSKNEICSAIESFIPDDKFIRMYTLQSGVRVVDDGDTSNPKGFEAIITFAKMMRAKKKILITPGIVDLGQDSKEIHTKLAVHAKKVFDSVIFVGEAGKQSFVSVFNDDLLTTKEQLQEIMSTLDSDDLLVIEGRMPAWVQQYFK